MDKKKINVLNLPDYDNAVDITEDCTYSHFDNSWDRFVYLMPQTGYIRAVCVTLNTSSGSRMILDYGNPNELKAIVNIRKMVTEVTTFGSTASTIVSPTPILKGHDFRIDVTRNAYSDMHIYFYPLK